MDNFVVSARKYRPQKFEDVVGQQSIANTLKMAIKNQKLASAYLFCGPRGVGKTTCARIFAKAINCLNPHPDGEACEECDSCRSFNEQRSVNIQELNAAANNSVEDIRAIIDQVRIPPQLGKYKVIILDEVHMLSQAAGNALLKTLEEPPSYVIFILATTEKQKIMQTILSRCQIFDFNRMEIGDIVGNLSQIAEKEGISVTDDALNLIAQKADGGMRDALSIFDQVSNFSQGNITADSVMQCINALDSDYFFRMTDLLLQHNVVESMVLFNDIVNRGFSGGVFIGGLAGHMRDLLMSRDPATMPLLNAADSLRQRYAEQAAKCPVKFLYYAIRTCDRCSNEYRTSYNKRLSVEIALIETAQYGEDDDSASAGLSPAKILKPIFILLPSKTKEDKPEAASPRLTAPTQETPATHQPTTPQPQVAAAKPTIKLGARRPSLREMLATGQQQAAAAAEQPQLDNLPDTPAAPSPFLSQAISAPTIEERWQLCCHFIGETDQVVATRMEGMPVKLANADTLVITLTNERVQQTLEPFLPNISQFMQQAYANTNLKIETELLPPEIVKVITSPTKLLAKMKGDNPYFAKIIDELQLQLT